MSFVRACVVTIVASATLCAGMIETALATGNDPGLVRSHEQDFDPAARATTTAEADADAEDEEVGAGSHDLCGCPSVAAKATTIEPDGVGRLLTAEPCRGSDRRFAVCSIRGPPVRA